MQYNYEDEVLIIHLFRETTLTQPVVNFGAQQEIEVKKRDGDGCMFVSGHVFRRLWYLNLIRGRQCKNQIVFGATASEDHANMGCFS